MTAKRRWLVQSPDDAAIAALQRALELPRPIAATHVGRGLDHPAAVAHFLDPRLSDLRDPFLLPDMDSAVERLWRAIEGRETIAVYGDYDVDGVTSTALLLRVLKALGAKAEPFLPHRVDDGYGLGFEPLRRCLDQVHPRLIVTVDCGSNAVESVAAARQEGCDVIVTDHHEIREGPQPNYPLVNPQRGTRDELKTLAGVGVAFKLGHALVKAGRDSGREAAFELDLRKYLDLVALGTIADIVPLTGENRTLAHHGMRVLNTRSHPGLKALAEVAGLRDTLDSYHVGFMLAPRLNAAGRMGEAETALHLLLCSNPAEASKLAAHLDSENTKRREVEKQTFEAARKALDETFQPERDFGLVAEGQGWHPGVIGIVASRIVRRFNRPAVIIALNGAGEGKGSGRSIESFDLVAGLESCAPLLDQFGGHPMAAGLRMRAENLEAFRQAFNQAAAEKLSSLDLRPQLLIEALASPEELSLETVDELDRLGPFGMENRRPVWMMPSVELAAEPRVVGQKHLKMRIAAGREPLDAIWFGGAENGVPAGKLDIAFVPQRNVFRGQTTLQLVVQDIRPAVSE